MTQTSEDLRDTSFAGWAHRIGRHLANIRDQRGISAQELAGLTDDLECPVSRSTIANLESGRKTSVSVVEVTVLAAALNIAPIRLLFDVAGPDIELLPTKRSGAVRAANWFSGLAPAPGRSENEHPRETYAGPLAVARAYDSAIKALLDYGAARSAEPSRAEEILDLEAQLFDALMARFNAARLAMKAAGLTEPELGPKVHLYLMAQQEDA